MAGARGNASVAERFNLTEAEADWVERQVAAGRDVKDVVVEVRSERIGPASDSEFRPLSADAAAELGVDGGEEAPPETVELIDDEVPFDESEEEING